jgi:hypothetical protein
MSIAAMDWSSGAWPNALRRVADSRRILLPGA